MGRTITPTFRVEYLAVRLRDGRRFRQSQAWPTKHAGRPSDDTLAGFVEVHEASTAPGGVNAHLGHELISEARVIRQSSGAVVAAYQAPAFAVAA